MNDENTVKYKSKKFAIRIVKLYKFLYDVKQEFVMSKQLLRCGTSIGANIAEAECAISKKDFANKMHIAYKECSETLYWLELLFDTDFLDEKQFSDIYKDCKELVKMLASITKTATANR